MAGADKDGSIGGMGRKHRLPPQHCNHRKTGRDDAQAGNKVLANCSLSEMLASLAKNVFSIEVGRVFIICNEGRQGDSDSEWQL